MTDKPILLFHVPSVAVEFHEDYNLLHGPEVGTLERIIAGYVGAKYAVSFNSASSALFLMFKYLIDPVIGQETISIPGMIPPVVPNTIMNAGYEPSFTNDTSWVGYYYKTRVGHYRLWDCAQYIKKDIYKSIHNAEDDLMLFSFFPTKPISGCDGGMVVSNDEEAIEKLRTASMNGYEHSQRKASWMKDLKLPGWKMYMSTMQASVIIDNWTEYEDKINALYIVNAWYQDYLPKMDMPIRKAKLPLHLFTIYVENNINFLAFMRKNNIECGIHYSATFLHPVYDKYRTSDLTNVAIQSHRTASLPYHDKLTGGDVKRISNLVEEYITSAYKEMHS